MAKHSPRFQKLCEESKARVKETTVADVKRRLDRGDKSFVLVDVREESEWGAGHIPATPRPEEEAGNVGIAAHRDSFFRGLKEIQKDDTIELTTLDLTRDDDGVYLNYVVEFELSRSV